MGSTWPFLLMFESRVERDTHFVALRHSMVICIPRVDGLSTDPQVWGVTIQSLKKTLSKFSTFLN